MFASFSLTSTISVFVELNGSSVNFSFLMLLRQLDSKNFTASCVR